MTHRHRRRHTHTVARTATRAHNDTRTRRGPRRPGRPSSGARGEWRQKIVVNVAIPRVLLPLFIPGEFYALLVRLKPLIKKTPRRPRRRQEHLSPGSPAVGDGSKEPEGEEEGEGGGDGERMVETEPPESSGPLPSSPPGWSSGYPVPSREKSQRYLLTHSTTFSIPGPSPTLL